MEIIYCDTSPNNRAFKYKVAGPLPKGWEPYSGSLENLGACYEEFQETVKNKISASTVKSILESKIELSNFKASADFWVNLDEKQKKEWKDYRDKCLKYMSKLIAIIKKDPASIIEKPAVSKAIGKDPLKRGLFD